MTFIKENKSLDEKSECKERYEPDFFYSEEHEASKPKGPLSVLPSRKHIIPSASLYLLFYLLTSAAKRYSFLDSLTVSGTAIFNDLEIWRLFTAIIIHYNLSHLLSNGFLFVLFGSMLYAYFGYYIFPVAALFIGLVTNFIVILFYPPHIQLLGASGMIHGMVALWIVFYVRFDSDNKIPLKIFRSIGFILIMLFPSTFSPQTSYLSHGIGFLTGIITGIALLPFVKASKPS